MKKRKFTVEDYLLNEDFIRWVKTDDPDLKNYWEKWLKKNPDQAEIIEKAKQDIKLLASDKDDHFTEELNEVWERINNSIEKSDFSSSGSSGNTKFLWYKWAAVFAGIILLGSYVFFYQNGEQQIFETAFGETQVIYLPDSSRVTLNANSSITLKNNWGVGNEREVWLEGEAFFEVKKQDHQINLPGKKFQVYAHNLNVEVLGTEFNVNSRRGLVKVILNSGEITINSKNEKLLMKPGDMVEYSPTEKFTQKSVEPEKFTSWRFQKIIFDKATLQEISQVIEDNYGVSVEFSEASLAQRNFTGVVSYQDLDIFLAILAESLNLNIIKKREKILINERRK